MTPAPDPAAPAPAPAGAFSRVDSALEEGLRAMQALQDCGKLTATLKADLAKKKKELKDEFGTPPPSFDSLLLMKRKRIDKQQQLCLEAVPQPGLLFSKAHELLRQIEPKNMTGVATRFKKVEAARARYNQMLAIAKEPKK